MNYDMIPPGNELIATMQHKNQIRLFLKSSTEKIFVIDGIDYDHFYLDSFGKKFGYLYKYIYHSRCLNRQALKNTLNSFFVKNRGVTARNGRYDRLVNTLLSINEKYLFVFDNASAVTQRISYLRESITIALFSDDDL